MKEKSAKLRYEIAKLQASAETLKSEANTLIERSMEIVKEIEKRTSPASGKTNSNTNAA